MGEDSHPDDACQRSAAPSPACDSQDSRERLPNALPALDDCRVLIVDDNADAADSVALLLEGMGAEVRVAYDSAATLDLLAGFTPDAVILDISMPSMDGYQLARRIRGEPGTAAALLVAVTGWTKPEDRERSLAAGFDHHLTKPLDLDALLGVLVMRCASLSR